MNKSLFTCQMCGHEYHSPEFLETKKRNELIIAVAKAIEGPHSTQHITVARLLELREVRWDQLSEQDKGVRCVEARAAIDSVEVLGQKK